MTTTAEAAALATARGDDYVAPTVDDKKAASDLAAKAEKDKADEAEIERLAAEKKEKDDADKDLTDEEKAAKAEKEAEEGKKDKDTRIPLSRHKTILEAERRARDVAEAKLAQYENGKDFAATNAALTKMETDLLTLEERHNKEVVDGDTAAANKTNAEIRKLDKTISAQRVALAAEAAESRAYERARYDVVVERVEAAFPTLNPDLTDTYDKSAMNKIMRIAETYQTDGMTPAKALQAAVKDIMGDPETAKQKTAVDTTPKVDDEAVAAAAAAARKEAAVKKALETEGKQPPVVKTGLNSDALGGGLGNVDVMKLDQDAFAKLDAETLSKIRGDELA